MFVWPEYAVHLEGNGRPPEERLGAILAELGGWASEPSAKEVLRALFDDAVLVDAVARLAPRLHHVGLIAPARLDAVAIEHVLRASPFGSQVRSFKSVAVAKELSARLGRTVDVKVMRGEAGRPASGCPAVEIFIPDLPARDIEDLLAGEFGGHVALELAPSGSLARIIDVLHTHGCWEIPLMRDGPLTNEEIHSSVLFVDVPANGRTRRLELITSEARETALVASR